MNLQERVETFVLRLMARLPARLQRLLAGPRLLRDGQTLAVDVQLMLRLQRLSRAPGVETLAVPLGRALLDHQAVMAGGEHGIGSVRDLTAAGLPVRLYVPTASGPGSPLLVFYHGGGFVFGGLESHDAACRVLAERTRMRVLSVDYRLAPEHAFPAAADDAMAALRWAREHAVELGANPDLLLVGGDSAGGNLAAVTAIAAAQEGIALLLQLLVYPAVDRAGVYRSQTLFNRDFYLTQGFMDLAADSYTPDVATRLDPRVSPLLLEQLPAGLAPAYIATAGFDPLRDEGEAYAGKLRAAGIAVEVNRFDDQIHGFLNTLVLPSSARCVAQIADRVREQVATARIADFPLIAERSA